MLKDEFNSLIPGQVIYDSEFNCYGEVKFGNWRTVGITSIKEGNGLYIHWDDGDNSRVGMDLHSEKDITKFELYDGNPT